ncbi:MAG: FecR domain-containing protein [Planctomycetales bacterium]|nr:FecR domain-containing protein [Planctomycetales bacterium]
MVPKSLIQRYLVGDISEDEVAELDRLLADDPDLRREFVLGAVTDAGLREIAMERAAEPVQRQSRASLEAWSRRVVWLSVAAAVVMVLAFGSSLFQQDSIATLVSSENAAWESSLPTTPGSKLEPGILVLKSGVATICFDSGAKVVLEAPAELELFTPMRTRLLAGAAMIDVPESAIGFVVETPDGYAIDYGTQFAVNVDRQQSQSRFEIIEGEISVHHPKTGDEVRLNGQGKSATVTDQALVVTDSRAMEAIGGTPRGIIRVGTNGRTASAVRHNRRKYIDPDVLLVKRTNKGEWDFRSFFSFDMSTVNLSEVDSARLRLNLVPSSRGFASRLPEINRFGIYGLVERAKADWTIDSLWEESPGPEDGVLLGTFEIPRSQQRGSFGIQNDELLKFLRANQGGPVTLILVRETTQIHGEGPGLAHTFASDSHPEAVGPMLEFTLKSKP